MKQRVITAVIALILFIPIVLAGGLWMDWLTVLFAAVGISEIFLMKKQILVSFDFLLALLATLTWTVPDSFFLKYSLQALLSLEYSLELLCFS